MAISEQIMLLGKGLYSNIPDVLTLKSIPTASELEYVGAENFQQTMLDKILPQSVEEKIDFYKLLDLDYQWICRALRILNYGPYYTVNTIYCPNCGAVTGEARVDLRNVDVKVLPDGFTNDVIVSRDEFIDFDQDVHLHLLTVREVMDLQEDRLFKDPVTGKMNVELAEMCYMITSIGEQTHLVPSETRLILKNQNKFSPADYSILKSVARQLTDYGLRIGGTCRCQKCNSKEAKFLALVDDKFFRPTLGDLRQWKHDRSTGGDTDAQ